MSEEYNSIKKHLNDQGSFGILFFRLGDFYESFFDDAIKMREIFGDSSANYSERMGFPIFGVRVFEESKIKFKYLIEHGYNVLIKDGEEISAW